MDMGETAMQPPHVHYMEFWPFPETGEISPYCKLCNQWAFDRHCIAKRHCSRIPYPEYWLNVWNRNAEDVRRRILGAGYMQPPLPSFVPSQVPSFVPSQVPSQHAQPARPANLTSREDMFAVEVRRISTMESTNDHWSLLSVERNADYSVISTQWRALCKLLHPDKRPLLAEMERLRITVQEADTAFQRVQNAFQKVAGSAPRPAPVPPPQSPGCTSQPAARTPGKAPPAGAAPPPGKAPAPGAVPAKLVASPAASSRGMAPPPPKSRPPNEADKIPVLQCPVESPCDVFQFAQTRQVD